MDSLRKSSAAISWMARPELLSAFCTAETMRSLWYGLILRYSVQSDFRFGRASVKVDPVALPIEGEGMMLIWAFEAEVMMSR